MHLPKYSTKNHPLFNCGNANCPICAKAYSQLKIKKMPLKESFSSQAVAPFIGRFGYPHINIGVLAPPMSEEDTWMYDAPRYWAANDFQIPKIIDFRSSLINSKTNIHIKKKEQFLELNQEVALASLPVPIDVELKKKPVVRVNFDNLMAPQGPQAEIEKAKLTQNPKIHTKVQKVHYASDMKAADALAYLYENKFDENFLSRIFSVGSIGLETNRKIVPTRWSIVATDSQIGDHLVSKIKKYSHTNYLAFFGGYLGNFYAIFFFPEVWNYELFETHISKPDHFMTDYEPYGGRKTYAEQTAGGFYACRLSISEKLNQMKRQGSVLALRFITGDYTLPLGVFVCREAARKALQNVPIEFSSKELMLDYAKKLSWKRFGIKIDNIIGGSILLKSIKGQSKLASFL